MPDGNNGQEYWDKIWSNPRRKTSYWSNKISSDMVRAVGAKSVLDVGCGSGTVLAWLKDLDCLGIDISNKAIERLKEYGVKGLVMDVYDIDKLDRTFDFVICNHTLEHIIRDEELVNKCKDRLNVGGTCFTAVPNDMSYPEETGEHMRKYNKEQLLKLMNKVFGNAESQIVGNHLMVWSKKLCKQSVATL